MRATGQARNLTGPLDPEEARVVVARAILGEWLGGSGGGWQDSGGIFPGVKLIQGVAAARGRPRVGRQPGPPAARPPPARTAASRNRGQTAGRVRIRSPRPWRRAWSLVHGGMAQNVGPILNMVTAQVPAPRAATSGWPGRRPWRSSTQIVAAVEPADVRALGQLTTRNWDGPLKRIIPWVTNEFTESIIREAQRGPGRRLLGLPDARRDVGRRHGVLRRARPPRRVPGPDRRDHAPRQSARSTTPCPFAMEPVVYDFRINPHGTFATLDAGADAMMPPRYYTLQVPRMIAAGTGGASLPSPGRRRPLRQPLPRHRRAAPRLPDDDQQPLPGHPVAPPTARRPQWDAEAAADPPRERLRPRPARAAARRPPARADRPGPQPPARRPRHPRRRRLRPDPGSTRPFAPAAIARGESALARGEVAVVTLAAGVGSRWTTGAGVVKAVNPFVDLDGRHRSFLEIHLAKTRKTQRSARGHDPARRHDQLPDARRHRAPPARRPATTATTARSTSPAASRSASG